MPPAFLFDSYNISLNLNNKKICSTEKKWSMPYVNQEEPQDDNDWLTCNIPEYYDLLPGEDKEVVAYLCFEVPQYFVDNCDVSHHAHIVRHIHKNKELHGRRN